MSRFVTSILGSKPKPSKRRALVLPLPQSSDAKALASWGTNQLDEWLDHIANRVYYAYTTVKLLTQASQEKYQSPHMVKQSKRILSLSDLVMNAVWGWNASLREIKGFSSKWLQYDIDQELQDALLRVKPVLETLEDSSSRLVQSSSSWEVFVNFCMWLKDVCVFFVLVVVEMLHAVLLFAVSVVDVIIDLVTDPSKRKEAGAVFVNFVRWLHAQYFQNGSVLSKTLLSAIFKIAPHILAYFFRPWSYVIQVMYYLMKKLLRMAEENDGEMNSALRVSAVALRKLLLRFRRVAWSLWRPLFTKAILNDKIVPGSSSASSSASWISSTKPNSSSSTFGSPSIFSSPPAKSKL